MTDWIEYNGGPQPVGDDVWVETGQLYNGTHRNLAGWIRWDRKTIYRILNQHLIDAALERGIELGLEAAKRHAEAITALQSGRLVAIPSLDPDTIAREAVLDQLAREAQADNMGYDND